MHWKVTSTQFSPICFANFGIINTQMIQLSLGIGIHDLLLSYDALLNLFCCCSAS
jgi:hypothetical protein